MFPRGGPDGGDAACAGTIYLTVDPGETSLRDYRHATTSRARRVVAGPGSASTARPAMT